MEPCAVSSYEVPTSMRAAILTAPGQLLAVRKIGLPPLSTGQVLVKLAYSGICRSQLMEIKGLRGEDKYLPHLLGHEGSGIVVAIGPQVSKVRRGDRVVLTWIKGAGIDCQGPLYSSESGPINAGAVTTFNEYAIAVENRVAKIPDDLPLDQAWLYGCAIPTGAGIVINTMRATPQNTIAIFGLGGVGLSALIAATAIGCRQIFAIDTEANKLELALELGASSVINSREQDPFSTLTQLTQQRGVDFAVEASGSAAVIASAFRSVRVNGGRCVFASHPPAHERISLDPFDLICGKKIEGSWGGEFNPDRDIALFAELYQRSRVDLSKLRLSFYTLDQINEALSDLEEKKLTRAALILDPSLQ